MADPTAQNDPALASEVLRLRRENEQLRSTSMVAVAPGRPDIKLTVDTERTCHVCGNAISDPQYGVTSQTTSKDLFVAYWQHIGEDAYCHEHCSKFMCKATNPDNGGGVGKERLYLTIGKVVD